MIMIIMKISKVFSKGSSHRNASVHVNSSNISNCKMVGGDIVRISWKYTRIYHEDIMRMSVN
jgi:hypothetical protein